MTDITILRGDDIADLLEGREREILSLVRDAYLLHGQGQSHLPHSVFLRFPEEPANRIIALPAFLGGQFRAAGLKWISSFPGNVRKHMERASAALILNSTQDGRITAILESSLISAKRTAASAALGARALFPGGDPGRLGLIGCGPINFEILRFLRVEFPGLRRVALYDRNPERMPRFQAKVLESMDGLEVEPVAGNAEILCGCDLVSFATTAATPHIESLGSGGPSVILHISLRDLSPGIILAADNVVDDREHVCRAQTSVHLAEQAVGHRDFLRAELWEILAGRQPARPHLEKASIYSPFGLGVLDVAVGCYALSLDGEAGRGMKVSAFQPKPWFERA